MVLQRRVGLRDWLIVSGVVILAQLTGIHPISWVVFTVLLVTSAVMVALWWFVYPRQSAERGRIQVALMNAVTALAAALLVHASGGPESPYIFFYALLIVFIIAFIEGTAVRVALLALTIACALIPLARALSATDQREFAAAIAVAIPIWVLMAMLIDWKRRSAERAELEARRVAYVDGMTGAANRRALEEYAEDLALIELPYALAVVRFGRIDEINRDAGHFFGDEALRRAVAAMRDASYELDQVGRLGGTTFAVLLPGGDDAAAQRWCSRLQERLEIANAGADPGTSLSARGGGAAAAPGQPLGEVVAAADRSMRDLVSVEAAPHGEATTLAALRTERLGARIRQHADERDSSAASIDAPTSIWLSIPIALLLGAAIALTGGASSVWISLVILIAAYFAVFGSPLEAIIATFSTMIAATVAVLLNAPISTVEQMRTLTVFATVATISDSVQRNSRMLVDAERRAAELSLVDALTGVLNRTAFLSELERAIAESAAVHASREQRLEGPAAIVVLELSGFPGLRDRLGHAGGDLLLLEAADVLRDALDGVGNVYRVAPYEFATIFHSHHRHHVDAVAERCADAVRELAATPRYSSGANAIEPRTGGATWESDGNAYEMFAAAQAERSGAAPASASMKSMAR